MATSVGTDEHHFGIKRAETPRGPGSRGARGWADNKADEQVDPRPQGTTGDVVEVEATRQLKPIDAARNAIPRHTRQPLSGTI